MMKLGFKRDFAVQVRHQEQERDEEEEWGALFYRGIFSVTLNQWKKDSPNRAELAAFKAFVEEYMSEWKRYLL